MATMAGIGSGSRRSPLSAGAGLGGRGGVGFFSATFFGGGGVVLREAGAFRSIAVIAWVTSSIDRNRSLGLGANILPNNGCSAGGRIDRSGPARRRSTASTRVEPMSIGLPLNTASMTRPRL